ncbi:MAG: type pilus assembly protein PilM [Patescibacteria group bacterium]|nr:type pilus assembly protein PilM [Patescibacteria group bacterium]
MFLKNKNKTSGMGVDIGTKTIRFVEISQNKNEFILDNYGEVNLDLACRDFFRSFDKNNLNPDIENISKSIKALMIEADVNSKRVSFSLPDFSTFFTTIEIPPMSEKEIEGAVGFEARKYIPLPLDEVVLDWQFMNDSSKKETNKILVMAVSKKVVSQYKEIAKRSEMELVSLEAEALSLKRSLMNGNNQENACLVEIGYQSTNVSIVKNGYMIMSSTFDIAGKDITDAISQGFNVTTEEAEKAKRKYGILENEEISLVEAISPILQSIFERIKQVIANSEKKEDIVISKIIFSGGTSLMPGMINSFKDFFDRTGKKIEIENGKPFQNIKYSPLLEQKMEEINANYAIALGEALRKFD